MGRIRSRISAIETDSTYLWIHHKQHLKYVSSLNQRCWGFSGLQFLVYCLAGALQMEYIRRLLVGPRKPNNTGGGPKVKNNNIMPSSTGGISHTIKPRGSDSSSMVGMGML